MSVSVVDSESQASSAAASLTGEAKLSKMPARMQQIFRSKAPVVMLVTEEEDRTLLRLQSVWRTLNRPWDDEVAKPNSAVTEADQKVGPLVKMTVYNAVLGPRPIKDAVAGMRMAPPLDPQPADIMDQLHAAYRWEAPKFNPNLKHLPTPRHLFVFQNCDTWLSNPASNTLRQLLLEFAYQARNNPRNSKTIVLLSRSGYVPQALSRYLEVVGDVTASDADLENLLTEFKERAPVADKVAFASDTVQALKGLTYYESRSALDLAAVLALSRQSSADEKCQILSQDILDYKRNQLRQSNLLTFVESNDSLDQLGGLGAFKQWAEEQKHTWTAEGQAYGLKPPKGVLNVGVWGCGKSHSAKALGRIWGLPVIQLEMGKLRDSAVGGSEANVYQAIRMIEAVGPCVVFTDEAEKSFAGAASSAATEGGIMSRMIGILSTWIQESKSPFCLVLTANSVKNLPIEFVNRLTERFFFDLPSSEERISVLQNLLARANQDLTHFSDFASLAAASEGMVPREMEQAIQAANVKSFIAKKPYLDEDLLRAELQSKPRITTTMTDELRELREWVGRDSRSGEGIRARLASNPAKSAVNFKVL